MLTLLRRWLGNKKRIGVALDFSFLENGVYEAVVFKDGINADREATDYKREIIKISSGDKLTIKLAPGGGWVARMKKIWSH